MDTFLGLHFTNTVDPAALVTFVLAVVAIIGLLLTRRSLNQTQEEIGLSRREVEEAHRPVVIPIIGKMPMDLGSDGQREMIPQALDDGRLVVPVENIGSGPALNVECSLQLLDVQPERVPAVRARIAGLAAGDLEPFVVDSYGIPVALDFALTVEYDDVAGKSWKTSCRYVNKGYETVNIASCKRTHYLPSGMVKPV